MNYIEKVEAEFDKRFAPEKHPHPNEKGKLVSYPYFKGTALEGEIREFIRTALTDFVKLAQSELEKMIDGETKHNGCQPFVCDGCYAVACKEAQSTLSRLLSGEEEK